MTMRDWVPSEDARASSGDARDEIIYESNRTRVFRRRLRDASIVCKEPVGRDSVRRLEHELGILRQLAGVAGVPRLAVGAHPTNTIALEDSNCVSLAEAVRTGSLDVPSLLELAVLLSRVVAGVHRAGVVHHDINPANVLISRAPWAVELIDFDLATAPGGQRPGLTARREIAGTLAYAAPEQTGRNGHPVDHRADLYALGVTLYELAVGRLPFESVDPLQIIHDHAAQVAMPPIERNPGLPQGLSDIIVRLLEKEPDRRYQSAEGLAYDLSALLVRGEAVLQLGTRDFPLRLSPVRLIGRDSEIDAVRAAFERALEGRGSGLFVTGGPGVGKSALVGELRTLVTARGGWFVSGKFDQYRHDAATGAVTQALGALARRLLAEPEADLTVQSARIGEILGPNAGLIASVLPEFAVLLGTAGDVAAAYRADGGLRLQLASVDVLRAVASATRPVVVFLDDLQWAPENSLRFIEVVLSDKRLSGVLLVGAYRDTEVGALGTLPAALARWESLHIKPPLLCLRNLPPTDVSVLLAQLLRMEPGQATQLADIVGARTGGNPYDTVEFINALRSDGVLVAGESGWEWDEATIRRYVGRADVVELLAARVAKLPAPSRFVLEAMACVGGELQLGVLAAATGIAQEALAHRLFPALEDGLIVAEHPTSDPIFERDTSLRFGHDRVLQAVYGGLEPQVRRELHLTIARRLSAFPDTAHNAAEQYLVAIEVIEAPAERIKVVELFRAAAANARRLTLYATAERFLSAAMGLVAAEPGAIHSPRFAPLEVEHHAALCSVARFEQADAVYTAIERRGSSVLALVEPAYVQIASLCSRGRSRDALALGFRMLGQLGLGAPGPDVRAEVVEQLDRLRTWFARLDRRADLERPGASDPTVTAAAMLIDQMRAPAFFLDPSIAFWLVLESWRLWAEHGPCAAMIACSSFVPLALMMVRGDYQTGYALSRHVLAVGDANGYGCELLRARFISLFSEHWFESLADDHSKARLIRTGLLQAGDVQYACFTYHVSVPALFECAPQLDEYVPELEAALSLASRSGDEHSSAMFLSFRQLLRALRGETDSVDRFADTSFDEAAFLAGQDCNPMARAYFHVNRALAGALFDDRADLVRHAAAAMPHLPYIESHYHVALGQFLQALALAERLRLASPDEHHRVSCELDHCRDWLARRAADAPDNFSHLLRLVDAERAWALDDFRAAAVAFDEAQAQAASRRRPWHCAFITERAGRFYLAHEMGVAGRELIAKACGLYDAWGASAKVRELERRYGTLRPAAGTTGDLDLHHTTAISADSIDLIAVLRASQALSSETSLERLRDRVTELLGEMTGATAVSLAFKDDTHQWRLLPPAKPGEISAPIPLDEAGACGLIPSSAVRYVLRSGEPLLVNDITRDDRFASDPALIGFEHCSLLVVPIASHGLQRAVVVLENSLTSGAFSVDRIDVVMLIAGQLAVSLDNALLYGALERKVVERTLALEQVNARLEALSVTDPLTGLTNRRGLAAVFEAEWARGTPLAVLMLDIDRFKLYNDRYGHLGGDACLRRVAAALSASARTGVDLVARYGGEEFAIILPDTDCAGARVVAERVRGAVAALAEPHLDVPLGIVTVSVGVAAAIPTQHSSIEQLLARADAALYEAKRAGRNQVIASAQAA
jgi:diguanylate cyclase (GGDEF)-like protein